MNKKIALLLGMLLILVGCSISLEDNPKKEVKNEKVEQDYVEPYIDDNPIKLGLYVNHDGIRNLITNYDCDLIMYKDIVSLEVYYTNDFSFSGNQKTLWNNYYQTYKNIDKYKIGYHISFNIGDNVIDKVILKPSDANSFFDYIQIYLYDDINQESGVYSHITDEEMNENSILTSIKLTASTKITEVVGPIKVIAFTYYNDDFDENGFYRGNSRYEVLIDRK